MRNKLPQIVYEIAEEIAAPVQLYLGIKIKLAIIFATAEHVKNTIALVCFPNAIYTGCRILKKIMEKLPQNNIIVKS